MKICLTTASEQRAACCMWKWRARPTGAWIVVHLADPGSRARQVAAVAALHRARGSGGAPLVVAGDFNDWGLQTGACWRVLACASLTMPAPSPTRPG